MRQRLFLSLLITLLVLSGYAQVITRQQAQQKALTFMRQKGMSVSQGVTKATLTLTTGQQEPIYVFNNTEGKGFVIVSGDERTEEILGYADEGQFDERHLSETMRVWLKNYISQIDDLRKGQLKASPIRVPTHQIVNKLITAAWDQGEASESGDAYNQQCPTISKKHCFVGCVATAMAQVMRYHQWPDNYTTEIPAYRSNDDLGTLSKLSKVKFDWKNMVDRYDEGQTNAQCNAVAQLMKYCGYSVKMDYGTDASSAYTNDVAMAMRTYFGYDINTRYVKRSDYSIEGWDDLIYNEVSHGRPVIYSGNNPGGGHAFVCDGYDGQGFYHINWGWGGFCNGFFKLSILNPQGGGTGSSSSNNGYSDEQGAIVGIQKPTGTSKEMRTLSLEDFYSEGHVLSAQYGNRTSMDGTFDYGFAYQLYDANSTTFKLKKTSAYFEEWDARTYNLDLDQITLDDGIYNFHPYAILSGNSWYHMIGDYTKYFQVTFSGGKVTKITYHPLGSLLINNVECVSNGIVNQSQEISVTIQNKGEEYSGYFYLFASQSNSKGEYIDKVRIPVEAGGEETSSLFFTPKATGKWKIWLDIVEDGSNDLSPWEVEIRKAPTAKSKLSVVSYEIDPKTDAVFKAKIKNNGTDGYYMPILCYIFEPSKNYNISFDKSRNLNLPPGETVEVQFRFESLQLGSPYIIHMQNYTDHSSGQTEWLGKQCSFVVNEVADAIVTPTQTTTTPMDVYSTSGILVREKATTLDGLPKGIYIIGGKKRVVR